MGKQVIKETEREEDEYITKFDVLVKVHGKNPHRETYSYKTSQKEAIKGLGYLQTDNKDMVEHYLDWKPLGNFDKTTGRTLPEMFVGGLFKVRKYEFDNKYVYAHTDVQVFSLPKYLFDKIGEKPTIFVARREK